MRRLGHEHLWWHVIVMHDFLGLTFGCGLHANVSSHRPSRMGFSHRLLRRRAATAIRPGAGPKDVHI